MITIDADTRPGPPGATSSPAAAPAPSARRLSPGLRKLVLAAHVLVAVGWFGVVLAKLALDVAAVSALDREVARSAYLFVQIFDRSLFPPLAVGTLLTGVVLALGTPWGLFKHYWVVAKLALTLGVIVTGIVFVGAWVEEARVAASGPAALRLVYAALTHLLMLGAATVISIYKPWGRIRPDRHVEPRRGAQRP